MGVELFGLNESETMLAFGVAAALVLVGAIVGLLIGRRKDRPLVGFMLGLLALPGLVTIALLPKKEPAYY